MDRHGLDMSCLIMVSQCLYLRLRTANQTRSTPTPTAGFSKNKTKLLNSMHCLRIRYIALDLLITEEMNLWYLIDLSRPNFKSIASFPCLGLENTLLCPWYSIYITFIPIYGTTVCAQAQRRLRLFVNLMMIIHFNFIFLSNDEFLPESTRLLQISSHTTVFRTLPV